MNLLGLIGGMSWENTIEYYRLLNQLVNERLGDWNSAKILLYSVNFKDILSLQTSNDWDIIAEKIIEISIKLEKAGCSGILICSNTMHKIADKTEQHISIPLINVIDETAKAIKTRNIKNIGLLGTKFTMEEEFYSEKLRKIYGLNPIIPKKRDRNFIHKVIYEEFAQGLFLEKTKQKFMQIIKKLKNEGAEGIIMGCTEIPLLIKQDDVDIPLFDTLKIHLSSAVDYCL